MDITINDLTFINYGGSYTYDNHKFSYETQGIDSRIWDIKNEDKSLNNAKEKIRANTYGYNYSFDDNQLEISFSQGTDVRDNYTLNMRELDVDNKIYKVSFLV